MNDIIAEFQGLDDGRQAALACVSNEDRGKNRFNNIIPVEATRVKLKRSGRSDYINANFVTVNANKYICTQGPLENTCNDFWQMVFEQDVRVIVMLSSLVEKGKIRCHKYWPSLSHKYGNITVKFVKSVNLPGIQCRKFHIYDGDAVEGTERVVTQLQYTEWADFGVPSSTVAIRHLCEYYTHYLRNGGLGVVHCSAGVGRTGAFVAIHSCLTSLVRGQPCYVRDTVLTLRKQRVGMIQTAEQYLFVYQVLKDAMTNSTRDSLLTSSGEVEAMDVGDDEFHSSFEGRRSLSNSCGFSEVASMKGVNNSMALSK